MFTEALQDLPDTLLSDVLEQQLPTRYTLSNLEQELHDIKQRLAVLENSLLPVNEQLATSGGTADGESPAIQLILSDKNMGWKAAMRRILLLTFGVRTLGRSCAKSKKNAKSDKLDERKLNHIKGIILFLLL